MQVQNKDDALRNRTSLCAVSFLDSSWEKVVNMMTGIRLSVNVGVKKANDFSIVESGLRANDHGDNGDHFEFALPAVCYADKVDINLPSSDRFRSFAGGDSTFAFVDIGPLVFHKLRAFWGISPEFYSTSLGPERIIGQLLVGNLSSLAEQFSEGKSGSFFYYRYATLCSDGLSWQNGRLCAQRLCIFPILQLV